MPAAPTPALAAALAAVDPGWLGRVEYRAGSRWSALFPAREAAAVLDPSLHRDLARPSAGPAPSMRRVERTGCLLR